MFSKKRGYFMKPRQDGSGFIDLWVKRETTTQRIIRYVKRLKEKYAVNPFK